MKPITLLCSVVAMQLAVLPVLSSEPQFYSPFWDSPAKMPAALEVSGQADRTLWCVGLDKIDVGIGKEFPINNPHFPIARTPTYFPRSEIHHFLKTEKHKDLLVIWFEKPIMWQGPETVQEILAAFQEFVTDLGYKRVVIFGGHSMGVFIIYDSSVKSADSKEPDEK